MKLLAIDPGLTTGWAGWDLPGGPYGFSSGMVEGRYEFYDWFYHLLSVHYAETIKPIGNAISVIGHLAPFQIVIEQFTITEATARKSPQPDPYLIIGHVDGICHRDGIDLDYQLPSEAMTFSTNDKLKALEWYKPGKGHDNDAARHLLLYMMKNPDKSPYSRADLARLLGVI